METRKGGGPPDPLLTPSLEEVASSMKGKYRVDRAEGRASRSKGEHGAEPSHEDGTEGEAEERRDQERGRDEAREDRGRNRMRRAARYEDSWVGGGGWCLGRRGRSARTFWDC